MKPACTGLLCLSILVLGGCAIGYHARGKMSDVSGELRGKGFPDVGSGGGRFALNQPERGLYCDGVALPARDADAAADCAGQSGAGSLQCSDGRQYRIRWQALSCRAFEGSGEDGKGNSLKFRVDRRR